MPGQHSPGYDAAYKRWRRAADRRLRETHPDEWRRYFAEARIGHDLTDDQWAAFQADARQQVERRAGRTLTDGEAQQTIDADYKFSYIVGQRMMARPGFEDMLRERQAELDKKYPKGEPR